MTILKKERDTLEEAVSTLLGAAMKTGIDSAEVCATYSHKTKIVLEKQDFHLASSDEGYRLGLRVMKGQKHGFTSSNTLDPTELKELALIAAEIAGFSPENPFLGISPSGNVPSQAPKPIEDESLLKVSMQTQRDWAKLLKDEATKDKRFRLNDGSVEIQSSLFLVTNSFGTHQVESDVLCSWGLMGMGVESDNITSFDYFQGISRRKQGVLEQIQGSTGRFVASVLRGLKTGKGSNYKGPVVFSPRAVMDILVSGMSYHLDGRTVCEKTGRWGLEQLGKRLLNPKFTLQDLAWLTDRTGFSLFDREGTPTRNLALVENGELSSFMLDHYAARALKLSSTGHALGNPSSLPSVGSHCLVVAPGETAKAELLKMAASKQNEFLYVHRYSGQVDPVTGDFSGVAKAAEWWDGSGYLHTLKETLISGNVFDALSDQLLAISTESEILDCGEESPTMLIDNISVTSQN